MKTWAILLIICLSVAVIASALTFSVSQLAKERRLSSKKKWWAFGLSIFGAVMIASIIISCVLIPQNVEKKITLPQMLESEINIQAEKNIKQALTSNLLAQGALQEEIEEQIESKINNLKETGEYQQILDDAKQEIMKDDAKMQQIEASAEKKLISARAKEINRILMTVFSINIAAVLTAFAVILMLLYGGKEGGINTIKSKYFSSKNITCIATFSAIASILYIIAKFPLPIFPAFLDIQISDMPALLAGFMMGPHAGIAVIIIKTLIKLPFSGTQWVGELADVILGVAFVLPASLIYKYNKSKKGAIIGLLAGSLSCTVVAIIVNRFIVIPFYVFAMFDGKWEPLLGMVRPLYKDITQQTFYKYYLWLAVLPFNLLRCLVSSLVTFFLYKSLSKAFNKIFMAKDKPLEEMPKPQTQS